MNCWRVQNLIAPFLDDALPDAESGAVAEHLEACPPCSTLVEEVAGLPELPRIELDEEVSGPFFAEWDRCLKERIEAGIDAPLSAGGGALARLRAGELRLAPGIAVATAAMILLMAGLNWQTYSRLQRLEAAVEERDSIIASLQERVIESRPQIDSALAGGTLSVETPIFMPSQAPQALVGAAGLPPRYRLVSAEGPRLLR